MRLLNKTLKKNNCLKTTVSKATMINESQIFLRLQEGIFSDLRPCLIRMVILGIYAKPSWNLLLKKNDKISCLIVIISINTCVHFIEFKWVKCKSWKRW